MRDVRRWGALPVVARSVLPALAGALPPVAVAVAWIPVRTLSSDVVVALLLVSVVASTGWAGSRAAVVGATVGASAAFTFFDTAPYERFAFARQPDVATAACLVAVGLMTGELAVRVARSRRAEGVAASHLRRVRDAAAMVADGGEVVHLIGTVASQLQQLDGVQSAEYSAEQLPPGTPVMGRHGRTAQPGAGSVAIPVVAVGEVAGHFVLRTSRALQGQEALLAVTLADQVGAALAANTLLPPPPPVPPGPRLRLLRNP